MEESTAAAGPDWSNLPSDVLTTVLGELEFPDIFRAADVCTSWRTTARALRRLGIYSSPQTPCLLYTTAAAGPRAAELLSLADKQAYRARLPDPPIGERNIVGSSHGWLVTADARSDLHLLNPVTGEQVALPSVATIEHVTAVFDPAGNLERYDLSLYREEPQPYAVDVLRGVLYLKVVLSCDPSLGGCTVVVIHNPYRDISFARIGDEKWHQIPSSPSEPPRYSDCIFFRRRRVLANCTCFLSTKDYPGLLPNHVYFSDDDEYSLMDGHEICRDVGVFNLEVQGADKVVSPQPWLNWPVPVWITPNFNKINK